MYESQLGELKMQMSNIVNNYVTRYKPSVRALKKHGVWDKLGKNKNVVILKAYLSVFFRLHKNAFFTYT